MINKKSTHHGTGATATDLEFEADVLFQRLYGKWYAFSEVAGECLITEVPDDEIEKRLAVKKSIKHAA